LVLGQAYHALWTAPGCSTAATVDGNLGLDCPASRLREGPVSLEFDDTISDLGAQVSLFAWQVWLWVTLFLMIGWICVSLATAPYRPIGTSM
jgi:hypothetical protein